MDLTTVIAYGIPLWGILLIAAWELVWKAIAMYRAARKEQKVIYVLLLILNTVGIFPIIYLIATRNKEVN